MIGKFDKCLKSTMCTVYIMMRFYYYFLNNYIIALYFNNLNSKPYYSKNTKTFDFT
jgi:hypothetical protein